MKIDVEFKVLSAAAPEDLAARFATIDPAMRVAISLFVAISPHALRAQIVRHLDGSIVFTMLDAGESVTIQPSGAMVWAQPPDGPQRRLALVKSG